MPTIAAVRTQGVRARPRVGGARDRRGRGDLGRRRREPLGEAREEIVGELRRGAVDEARAELGDLAADARARGVGERGGGTVGRERDARLAVRESGRAALPFELQRVAHRRRHVRSRILPLKRACTGPMRVATTERHSVSVTRSNVSQPGMHAFSATGSFSAAHTAAGGAPIVRVCV